MRALPLLFIAFSLVALEARAQSSNIYIKPSAEEPYSRSDHFAEAVALRTYRRELDQSLQQVLDAQNNLNLLKLRLDKAHGVERKALKILTEMPLRRLSLTNWKQKPTIETIELSYILKNQTGREFEDVMVSLIFEPTGALAAKGLAVATIDVSLEILLEDRPFENGYQVQPRHLINLTQLREMWDLPADYPLLDQVNVTAEVVRFVTTRGVEYATDYHYLTDIMYKGLDGRIEAAEEQLEYLSEHHQFLELNPPKLK